MTTKVDFSKLEVKFDPKSKLNANCGYSDGNIGIIHRKKVIGCAYLWEDGHIGSLIVRPEYRGSGVGYFLMQAIKDKAKKLGIKRLSLGVSKKNPIAINLYTKCKFRNIHSHDPAYNFMICSLRK